MGQLRIVDPVPATPGFGANFTLTNLRFSLSADDSDQDYSVTRNGTIKVRTVKTVDDNSDPQRPVHTVYETVTEKDPNTDY